MLYPDAGRVGHPELFETPEHTYRTALTFIAERYERTLEREDSHGVIVLDSRERDSDERPRRFFDQIQQDGTQFTKLDRIVDSLLLGPSHDSIGLQVADLVVGTTMAAQAKLGDASRWTKSSTAVCDTPGDRRGERGGAEGVPRQPGGGPSRYPATKLFEV